MLSLYRRLIWYRKASPALLRGSYRSVGSAADGVFGYVREADGQRLLVALNFTDRPVGFGARELSASGRLELSTDPSRRLGELGLDPLRIGPDEGVVVRLA
jgi:alpha-glucosidase